MLLPRKWAFGIVEPSQRVESSSMLVSNTILEKLKAKQIAIRYAFIPNGDGTFRYVETPVDTVASDSAEFKFLQEGLIRNRLRVTLGALVYPLSSRAVPKKLRFLDHSHIVDLRKCQGGYSLAPGASAVVFTNEWVSLSKDFSAVIVSGVKNYKLGLVIAATLVDSQWEGILKLMITNVSNIPQPLSIMQDVGRMFFFGADGEPIADSSLIDTATHHELNWRHIFSGEIIPFDKPREISSTDVGVAQRLTVLTNFVSKWVGVALLPLLATCVFAGFNVYQRFQDMTKVSEVVPELKSSVSRLTSKMGYSGITDIEFREGATQAIAAPVSIRRGIHLEPGYAACSLEQPNDNIQLSCRFTGDSEQHILQIEAHQDQPSKSARYAVHWAVIP